MTESDWLGLLLRDRNNRELLGAFAWWLRDEADDDAGARLVEWGLGRWGTKGRRHLGPTDTNYRPAGEEYGWYWADCGRAWAVDWDAGLPGEVYANLAGGGG